MAALTPMPGNDAATHLRADLWRSGPNYRSRFSFRHGGPSHRVQPSRHHQQPSRLRRRWEVRRLLFVRDQPGACFRSHLERAGFQARPSNLIKRDTNGCEDVFVRDRGNNTTSMVSLNTVGNPADNNSYSPNISANGQYVSLISYSDNIVAGDTNGLLDVFRRGPY